jgi:hypothetical protein
MMVGGGSVVVVAGGWWWWWWWLVVVAANAAGTISVQSLITKQGGLWWDAQRLTRFHST